MCNADRHSFAGTMAASHTLAKIKKLVALYEKERWDLLPASERQRKVVPQWFKSVVAGTKPPSWRHSWPADVLERLDLYLAARTCSDGAAGKAEDFNQGSLAEVHEDMAKQARDAVDRSNMERHTANQELAAKLQRGQVSRQEALNQTQPILQVAKGKTSARWHAYKHQQEFGWSNREAGDKPHRYLGVQHPHMRALRQYVSWLISTKQIHPRMVLNVDHVFTWRHRIRHRRLFKDGKLAGQKAPCSRRSKFSGRLIKAGKFLTAIRTQALLQGRELGFGRRKRRRSDDAPEQAPRHDVVKRQRSGRTYVSASWRDGVMAPSFVTLGAEDAYSKEGQEAMKQINTKYAGYTRVVPSGRKTHMFNAELTRLYLDFLRLVYRQRRAELAAQLGLKHESLRGGLLWDAFAGNAQVGFRPLRQRWAEEMMVTIIGPGSPVKVPGGYSANGQPNDAWRQFLGCLKDAAERASLRVFSNPLERPELSQLPQNADGHLDGAVPLVTSLEASVHAQVNIPRNILLWAWRSRLLVSAEEQAAFIAEETGRPVEEVMLEFNAEDRQKARQRRAVFKALLCTYVRMHVHTYVWSYRAVKRVT